MKVVLLVEKVEQTLKSQTEAMSRQNLEINSKGEEFNASVTHGSRYLWKVYKKFVLQT